MITIIKCNCGDPICNRYGLSDGTFYQGNGWTKERAQEYADAVNSYEPLREACKKALTCASLNSDVRALIIAALDLEKQNDN